MGEMGPDPITHPAWIVFFCSSAPLRELSIEKVSQPHRDHDDGPGDLALFAESSVHQLGAGFVVSDHVADRAGVFLGPIDQDTTTGNRVATEEKPEIAE